MANGPLKQTVNKTHCAYTNGYKWPQHNRRFWSSELATGGCLMHRRNNHSFTHNTTFLRLANSFITVNPLLSTFFFLLFTSPLLSSSSSSFSYLNLFLQTLSKCVECSWFDMRTVQLALSIVAV